MAVIEKEIDARERAGATFVTTTRNHGIKDLLTAAALISGDSSSVCCSYCGHSHSSVSCKIAIGSNAWKHVLTKTGRCFLCLRKHHMRSDCKSTTKCYEDITLAFVPGLQSVYHQKHGRNIVSYSTMHISRMHVMMLNSNHLVHLLVHRNHLVYLHHHQVTSTTTRSPIRYHYASHNSIQDVSTRLM